MEAAGRQTFTTHEGIVVPLDRANVDTDQIIPKQFLKSIKRTGFGVNLFDAWRFKDEGTIGKPLEERVLNPDFILNKPEYEDGSILLARRNFGCGSSREHAVWALLQYGFKCVIAPTFADIFYNNSCNNGLLLVTLEEAEIDEIFRESQRNTQLKVNVDLQEQVVAVGDRSYSFEIDDKLRDKLMRGMDEISLTLEHADQIRSFESSHRSAYPWLFEQVNV